MLTHDESAVNDAVMDVGMSRWPRRQKGDAGQHGVREAEEALKKWPFLEAHLRG